MVFFCFFLREAKNHKKKQIGINLLKTIKIKTFFYEPNHYLLNNSDLLFTSTFYNLKSVQKSSTHYLMVR